MAQGFDCGVHKRGKAEKPPTQLLIQIFGGKIKQAIDLIIDIFINITDVYIGLPNFWLQTSY